MLFSLAHKHKHKIKKTNMFVFLVLMLMLMHFFENRIRQIRGSFFCLCLCLCRWCSHLLMLMFCLCLCLCLCASKNQPLVITWKRIIVVEEWFHSRLYNFMSSVKSRSRSTNCVRGSSVQHQICMFATGTAHPNLCNTDFNQGIQYKQRKLKTKALNGMQTVLTP